MLFPEQGVPEPTPTPLAWAHPLVRDWFVAKMSTPTEPQEHGWPHVLAGRNTLISAPTGSGKTLAAFLICIDKLIRKAAAGDLQDRTEVLYISPLKALGNDIQKNLELPLGEILANAGQQGMLMPEIRTAVRTGDTLMSERRAMLKRPPHILVTTPESLYILLTADKSRAILRDVTTVIVDEIHAVADDKRGAHLALSLERLEALTHQKPIRIGLSATQKPIEEVAQFLVGAHRPPPAIVDVGHKRPIDLAVEIPGDPLGPISSNEQWEEIYQRLAVLANQHRSTLVFVNTRRMVERLAHRLGELLGEDQVAAHHGSLARKLRLAAETKLKTGQIKLLVATASLELGIDIGSVDLVCQINTPRSIAVTLQRVGRSGHWRGAIPKGRLFATTRDDLVECAALVRAIRQGDLDRLIIPESPLDILAQQIVATCASEEWDEDALFDLFRHAYPYKNLTRETYERILEMLSEGIAAQRGRYGAYLHHDRVNKKLRARRGARLAAITSGGAIPDTALYAVVVEPDGANIGTLDEDFAIESSRGDIMLLGNTSWRIRRVESKTGRVLVEDAHGAPPTIPFWRGEAPARTDELSLRIGDLRQAISDMLPNTSPVGVTQHQPAVAATVAWLKQECGVDDSAAEQLVEYILEGRAVLGAVPTQKTIIAERFFDEGGGMQLVIHAPFGGRVNKAWGLALRKRFCRSFNFELQAAATDNGLNIALAEQHSFPLADVFQYLYADSVQPILEQAALDSPIFATRWRWDAQRTLALLRFRGGKKIPPQIQRMRSDDLLAAVFPDVAACQENIEGDIKIPDHPLVAEVMKDVLTEAMDIDGLRALLTGIQTGNIRCIAVDTPIPSQFSHEILNANPYAFLDDAPLEERRARAVEMRRMLPASVLEEVGKLDPAAIAQVREEAWPDVRDADELHDVLHTLIAVPEAPPNATAQYAASIFEWRRAFEHLILEHRATRAEVNGQQYWVAAERAQTFSILYENHVGTAAPGRPVLEITHPDALLTTITGWMAHIGPTTASNLARTLSQPTNEVDQALLRMEAAGSILRGNFTSSTEETEWCERRLLARIHRLTLGVLRKQIQPATSAQFLRWLLRWQHIAPQTQLTGERGLREVLNQLQGFEIPANAWEPEILSRRVANYDPQWLDQLCLTGAVGWGRLSPHPATLEDTAQGKRRVIPTSVAPVTFFARDDADWMIAKHSASDEGGATRGLSEGAIQVFEFLRQRGASFFIDVVKGTGKIKAEVETGLWELVAAGLVTADGFDNLRALIDPKRRSGQGSGRTTRPRHSSGRWSLLYSHAATDRATATTATCWMLLNRYGIVFRDLLTRETVVPKWRELLLAFRRLEDRGEVRGGRFVDGFLGEQFALPSAIESLRATRQQATTGEQVTVSAADPLNLVGIIVPGDRTPAISGRHVTYRDGIPQTESLIPRLAAGD
jgi:ATP-dependent Lhr-like helicase